MIWHIVFLSLSLSVRLSFRLSFVRHMIMEICVFLLLMLSCVAQSVIRIEFNTKGDKHLLLSHWSSLLSIQRKGN